MEKTADSENSSCFTANYVATGQTVVYIATTLVDLLPSLHISSACVCIVNVYVPSHSPTVPQPSGRLAVLGEESPPQVQSWLIAPHSHTTHPYKHTQKHIHTPAFSIVLLVGGRRRRINPNCGVWEPGERPGLLGASALIRRDADGNAPCPSHPLAVACAVYAYASDTRHSHAHIQQSTVS